MTPSPEQIACRVKTIKRRNPSYSDLVQWVGDLLSETAYVTERPCTHDFIPGQEPLTDAWSKGKPLLDPGKLNLDWEEACALFERLVRRLENEKKGSRQTEGLRQALAADRGKNHRLMKAVLTADFEIIETAAQECHVSPHVLSLFLRMSLRPALLSVSQTAQRHLDLNTWTFGHCPVCGSAPALASLAGDGGKRRLHCSLCETAWSYPRLRCPFCENEDPEGLTYMRAENEQGFRVDLCSDCGRYIKTLDLRELNGPVIVPLDDLATWHLDLIANREK